MAIGLGTILGLITHLYARSEATTKAAAAVQQRINEIDVEVYDRLESVSVVRWGDRELDAKGIPKDLVARVLLPPGDKHVIMYDLRNRTLRSLLFELHTLVPSDEAGKVAEALFILESFDNSGTGDPDKFIEWVAQIPPLRWTKQLEGGGTQKVKGGP